MSQRDGTKRGTRRTRFLSLLLSAAVVLPGNPFVAAAAAQVIGSNAGSIRAVPGAQAGAAGASAATTVPVPLSLSLPLTAPPLGLSASAPAALAPASPAAAAAAVAAAPAAAAFKASPAASLGEAKAAVPAALPAAIPAAAAALAPITAARSENDNAKDGSSSEAPAADAKLEGLFDGRKNLAPESVKLFLVRHGEAPVETTLASLPDLLKAEPEAAASLNKNGAVRLVLGNADGAALAASAEFKAKFPAALGVAEVNPLKQAWGGVTGNPLLKLFSLAFKRPSPRAVLASAASLPGRAVKEARFLGRTFVDSFTKPLKSEIIGGIATKSFPLTTSLGVYWTTIGMAHPFEMAGLMALSLTQEVFHGIFLNSWNNFQESLSRLRGFSYQMYFNLAYMQGFGAMYRALSWSANPHKTIPPWSPFYWKDVLVMSLVGTFFGTLGYNGLNTLYAKGRLKRWQRSGIQQLRDVLFLLAGPFFATGSMHAFWALFIFQQSLDFAIALLAWRAQSRTILYAAAAGDTAGKEPAELTAALTAAGVTAPVTSEKLTLEPSQK